jgi:hypothetical protein
MACEETSEAEKPGDAEAEKPETTEADPIAAT